MPQRGAPSAPPAQTKRGLDDLGAVRVSAPVSAPAPVGRRGSTAAALASPTPPPSRGLADLGAKRADAGTIGEEPWSVGGFLSNVVGSTRALGENVADLFRHPGDTLEGIGNLARGAYQNVGEMVNKVAARQEGSPGPFELFDLTVGPHLFESESGVPGHKININTGEVRDETQQPNPVDQVLNGLKERYGGWENLKKTAYHDPAGIAVDIAALMSGAGEGLNVAGKAAGMAKLAKTGATLSKVSEFVDPIRLAGKTAKGVASVAKPIATGAGRLASEGLGLTSGAGGEAIRTAFKSGHVNEFKDALRGQISIRDIATQVKSAVQQVRNQRGNLYRAQLSSLPQMSLDMQPIFKDLIQNLDDFGVELRPIYDKKTGAVKAVVPDFAKSKIGDAAAQNEVRKLVRDVTRWPKLHQMPIDAVDSTALDTLKQRLDNYYHETSPARKITANVRGSVRDALSQVPGYDTMTGNYERYTKFLNEIEPELSAKSKTALGTTVRKLTYALNQNNEYRQMLVEALDSATGRKLKEQLAGYALSKWAPRGLMRTVSGFNILYGIGHGFHPLQLVELVFTSPRAVGEAVSAAGEATGIAKKARALAKTQPGVAAVQPVNKALWNPAVYRPATVAADPESLKPEPPPR